MPFPSIKSIFLAAFAGILCLASAFPAVGQLYHNIEVLTSREGLSDNRITCVLKDKTGYLWIGTKNGLNRYDGHGFTIFKPQHDNSISNEVVNAIAEDRDGKIWVATMKGLNCYDPSKNTWRQYTTEGATPNESLPNPIVWSCFVDSANRVWISTDTHGPSALESDRKTFRHYNWKTFVKEIKPELTGEYFSVIKMLPVGDEIYLGSTIGIFKFNKNNGAFNWLGETNGNSVVDMQYDAANERVYMTSSKKEIFCYDERSRKYQQLYPTLFSFPSSSFFPATDNRVWIGFPDGLLLADKESGAIALQRHVSAIPLSIPDGGVNTIYQDNTGITWIAANNGLAKYDPQSQLSSFFPLTGSPGKATHNPMGSVYYDKAEDSYFVCSIESEEVFIINRTAGTVKSKKTDATGRKLGACYVIKPDNANQLWLLTDRHVYKYDRETGAFTLFPTPNGNTPVLFRSMAQDDEGNYWFAGFHSSLYFYDSNKKAFTSPPGNDAAFNIIAKVTSLLFDAANRAVWIGTFTSGLHKFDLSSKTIISYNEASAYPAYESLQLIHDLYQDPNQRLWIATHTGGLFYYQPDKPYQEAFDQVSMKEGMSSNSIYAVTGADSLIWAMSAKSVTVLNNRTASFIEELNEQRTFPSTVFSSDAHEPHSISFDSKRNALLIAAGGGLMLYKTSAEPQQYNFPVLLSSIAVNGHALADSIRQNTTPPGFSHPLKEIKLRFAALHYSQPSSITYQYKLEGYDNEWKTVSNINEVVYQNLPPGNYTFQLKAADFTGYASAIQAAFSFKVAPAFWQTRWFRLMVISAIVFVLYLWIRKLNRKIWIEQKLNQFTVSLYGKNTVDDILWDIANNCVRLLPFEDCVVYRYNEEKKALVQVAAAGPKKIEEKQAIFNPIEIPLGKGIVGAVAASGKPEIIADTHKDRRYILDDAQRASEITVPIVVDGKVFGIIDSEHAQKNFYTKQHLALLQKVAAVCSERLVKLLAEERLRDVIARDLHDEMGSTLTSIHILSSLAMQQQEGQKDMRYLGKIKEYTGSMMDKMSDIVWAINPQHDTVERLLLRMKEFAAELLEPAGIIYHIDTGNIQVGLSLSPEERKFLYLIFKEALNNSVKYSKATVISVALDQTDKQLSMTITDNGIGFDPVTAQKGNGLKNMEARAGLIGATLSIESKTGSGATIKMEKALTS